MRIFVMATLASLFLTMAGLQVDLTILARPSVLFAAVLTLAVAVGAKFTGLERVESLAIGAGPNARGWWRASWAPSACVSVS